MLDKLLALAAVGAVTLGPAGVTPDPWPFGRGERPLSARNTGAEADPAPTGSPQPVAAPARADPLSTVRSQLSATDAPFTLVVRMELKPGSEAEFERLASAAAAGTHREPGSILYEFNRSAADPKKIVLYERWRSFDDLKKHFEFEYMKNLLGRTGELLSSAPDLAVYLPLDAPASK